MERTNHRCYAKVERTRPRVWLPAPSLETSAGGNGFDEGVEPDSRGRLCSPWVEPFLLGNSFRRDAENGNRDGRAPQQRPNWWPCASTGQRQFGLDEWGKGCLNTY